MAKSAARLKRGRPGAGADPLSELPITVEAHDRQQIEIELSHALSGTEDPQSFSFELFCFIPRNVGVSAANYPRDEFYGDLTTFLRVDLPNVTLEELAEGSYAPLQRLMHY